MRSDKVTVTGANIVFFTFVVLTIPAQLILGALTVIFGDNFIKSNFYIITLTTQYGLILSPVLIYAHLKKINIRTAFRFNSLGLKPAILIAAISLPAIYATGMLNSIIIYLLQFIGNIPPTTFPQPKSIAELFIGIFVIAVTPALCEEILNRGLLLRAYENRGSFKAIIITALFFGIFHFDITNLFGPIFLGILIGYYVLRTNSIYAGMLAHFLNNAVAELMQYFYAGNDQYDTSVKIPTDQLFTDLVLGLAGLLLVWILLKLFNRVTEDQYYFRPAISSVKQDIISILSHWPVIIVLVFYIINIGAYLLAIIYA